MNAACSIYTLPLNWNRNRTRASIMQSDQVFDNL